MATDILDILYTPLEVPPAPKFDNKALLQWCSKNHVSGTDNRYNLDNEIYPWNFIYARLNHQWQENFNFMFPDLAEYFYSAFLLKELELSSVVLLQVKSEYVGAKYWHFDPDEIGLRLYLENDDIDRDFLLIKPTVKKYYSHDQGLKLDQVGDIPLNGVSPNIQDVVYSAKMPRSNRAFYINNVRSIHTANVNLSNSSRLAVIIFAGSKASDVPTATKELILKSAKK